jgi:hypothetical protein
MQLINSEYTFSYYNNLLSAKSPDNEFNINELIEVIKYGYIKKEVEALRNVEDKKIRAKLKQSKLPCVTLSGTFKKRSKDYLQEHSGLMQVDIDEVKDFNNVYNKIIADEFTFVTFKSPSGNGIKVIVKVNPSIDTHLEQFMALQKYYNDTYNIEIDSACKDIARCMLLSYDPNLYCNPFSEVYAELYMPEPKELPKSNKKLNYTISITSNNDNEVIENLTREIEKNSIDITNGYENWIRIGFSLASTLGENGRDHFHRLSRLNQGYNSSSCDKQYTNLLKRNNGAISLGTLIHIARNNGVDIVFPTKKENKSTEPTSNNSKVNKIALYEALKQKRLLLANKIGKPAFTVFTNKTLDALVEQIPKSETELLNIYGISEKKCNTYAKEILEVINNYTSNNLSFDKPLIQKYVLPKLNNEDRKLYLLLKEFRLQLANEKGMKAFYIFGNTTLNELVSIKPKNEQSLLQIKGFGSKKVKQFGDAILNIIKQLQLEEIE